MADYSLLQVTLTATQWKQFDDVIGSLIPGVLTAIVEKLLMSESVD